ncbi:putative esterase lipase [Phaeomoniella chlamydospora]|uniref:Putative esterase lipase n=1 Tax=Phaeomoniella chlamydospora TaxID=158046 RepID=A0A0G2EQ33_PHACM|nr:putative esterase lipase [Phaeomoniella chlamydospora]
MVILQTLVKPIRPRLISPPKHKSSSEGSAKLKPPSTISEKVEVQEHQICDVYVYEMTAKLPAGIKYRPKHDLYYFAGGSFVMPASKEHWTICAELARELPEYRIHIVGYPLAPKNRAAQSLPILRKLAVELCKKADKQNRNVTFAGDSSGGNIAMSLGLFTADEAIKEGDRRTQLKNILLISPAVDLRNRNPAITTTNRRDPVMTEKHIKWVADQWVGDGITADDPAVSPILANLTSLRTLGIKVHGIIGTYDVLAPDTIAFRQRLEEFGVGGEWLEWEKQMHCFPLAYTYHLRDAVQGKNWILDILRDHA